LLIGGVDGQGAKLWNQNTGKEVDTDKGGPGPVALSDDNTPLHLAPNPKDRRSLLLWNVAEQRIIKEFKIPTEEEPEPFTIKTLPRLAITSNGKYIAASAALPNGKGTVFLWEVSSGKLLYNFAETARALAFSPDASVLAAADTDGRITLRSLPKGESMGTLNAGRKNINCSATVLREQSAAGLGICPAGRCGRRPSGAESSSTAGVMAGRPSRGR